MSAELDKAIEIIEANSGADRTTPWWEAIRLVVAEAKRTTVYMIADNNLHEDSGGRDWWEEQIDPDYGYFTDREAAEAFITERNEPGAARYEAALTAYVAAVEAESAKAKQARELGFNHRGNMHWRPEPPSYLSVVEVTAK